MIWEPGSIHSSWWDSKFPDHGHVQISYMPYDWRGWSYIVSWCTGGVTWSDGCCGWYLLPMGLLRNIWQLSKKAFYQEMSRVNKYVESRKLTVQRFLCKINPGRYSMSSFWGLILVWRHPLGIKLVQKHTVKVCLQITTQMQGNPTREHPAMWAFLIWAFLMRAGREN